MTETSLEVFDRGEQQFDARQAAAYLAMSTEKLRRLAHAGTIEHLPGPHLRFTIAHLEQVRIRPGQLSHLVDQRHPR